MDITNLVVLAVGIVVLLIGLAAFVNPDFSRIISAPGGPRLKAIVAIIVGIILVVVSQLIVFSS